MSDISLIIDTSSFQEARTDFKNLGTSMQQLQKSAKSAAGVFEREFNKAERTAKRFATAARLQAKAAQENINTTLGVGRASRTAAAAQKDFEIALKRSDAAAKSLAASDAKLTAEKAKLAAKYKPLYAASMQYARALEEINRASKLGVISDSQKAASLVKLNSQFEAFNAGQYRAGSAFNQFGEQAAFGGRKMNAFNAKLQQGGYQLQDFVVQMQMGTNFFTAFAQQGSQFAGVFGPTGAVVGAGIAIGAVMAQMGIAFFGAKDDIKSAEDALSDFKSASSVVKASNDILNSSIKDLTEEYGKFAEAVRRSAVELSNLSAQKALKILKDSTVEFGSELDNVVRASEALNQALKQAETAQINPTTILLYREALQGAVDDSGLMLEQVLELDNLLENFSGARSMSELATAANEVVGYLESQYNSMSEAPEQVRKTYEQFVKYRDEVATTLTLLDDTTQQVILVNNELDSGRDILLKMVGFAGSLTSGFNSAATAAGNMADGLFRAAQNALAALQTTRTYKNALAVETSKADGTYGGRGSSAGAGSTQGDRIILGMGGENADELARRLATYKDKTDAAAKATEKLTEAQKAGLAITEKYLTPLEKYTKGMAELDDLLKQGEISTTTYERAMQDLNDTLAESNPLVNSLADAFGDFVAGGLKDFKGFVESIKNTFKKALSDMIATALRNRIMIPIQTAMMGGTGGVGGIASSVLGGGGGMGGMLGGIGGTLGSLGSIFAGSAGSVMSAFGSGGISAAIGQASLAMTGATASFGGFAAAAGAAIPFIGAAALAIGFFSTKTKKLDEGISLTANGMSVAVQQFEKIKKSRFFGLSSRTRTSSRAADADVANPLTNAIGGMQSSVMSMANAIGVGSKAFKRFSYSFKLSLKGLTEEQQMTKINEELVKMGDSFAALIPGVSSMAELTAIYQERLGLELRLLQVQGDTEALRKIELASVSEYNRALLKQIFAVEDKIAAEQRATEAAQVAAQKADELAQKLAAIASERYGLYTTLLGLQGRTNLLRKRELALLDPSNRALQKLIYKTEDKIAADEKAAQRAEELARKAEDLANQRKSLEEKLLGLQGNVVELRRREMEALDPTLRSLQMAIYKFEDMQKVLDDIDPAKFATKFEYELAQSRASNFVPAGNFSSVNLGTTQPVVLSDPQTNRELVTLRTTVENLLIRIEDNTGQNYRLERKWDRDGLPPERV